MPDPHPTHPRPSDPRPTVPWRRPAQALAGLGLATGLALLPAPARAWFVGGFGFAGPVIVAPPPPVYYPPPYPYPPPYALPPTYAQSPLGPDGQPATQSMPGMACYTGAYVCPLPNAGRVGARCSCPAESGGRAYGTIR